MKKAGLIALVSLVCLISSGCSFTDIMALLPATPTQIPPTLSPIATVYLTPTETPTITPTQPTPTFTLTPTLIYPNGTPPPTLTWTPPATLYVLSTASATAAPEPLLGNGVFSSILVSGPKILWGSCEPSSVTMTVKLMDNVSAVGVIIELRLQDPTTLDTTPWGGGAIMDKKGDGVFTYTLTAKSFEHYRDYKQAWGQYQFVAYTTGLRHVGSSQIYLNNLTIAPCP